MTMLDSSNALEFTKNGLRRLSIDSRMRLKLDRGKPRPSPFGEPQFDDLGRQERILARTLWQANSSCSTEELCVVLGGVKPSHVHAVVWKLRNKLGSFAVSQPRLGFYVWGQDQQELSR